MNLKIFTSLSLVGAALSISAFAQSSGSKGGGTIFKNHLRDLNDRTVCDVRTTRTFLHDPRYSDLRNELNRILDATEFFNPYMTYRIRNSMKQLTWCLTTDLKKINTKDQVYFSKDDLKEIQLAVRDIPQKRVYLDTERLKSIPIYDQAMTLIHETIHEFLPPETLTRNLYVRTLNRSIGNLSRYSTDAELRRIPLNDFIENFDQTVLMTGAAPSFESSAFGRAFASFVRKPNAKDAQILGHSKHPNEWMPYLIANFKRPSILSYSPFREVELDSTEFYSQRSQNVLANRYWFSEPYQMFRNNDKNFTPNNYDRLGTCEFSLKGPTASEAGEVFSTYEITGTHQFFSFKLPLKLFGTFHNFWGADVGEPDEATYTHDLIKLLNFLGEGICDDPTLSKNI